MFMEAKTKTTIKKKIAQLICLCCLTFTALKPKAATANITATELDAIIFKNMKIKAEEGDALSQYTLADMYHQGQGAPQNIEQALHWLKMSAQQGFRFAQNNLGLMYQNGYGTPVDHTEAFYWFQLAAWQDYPEAQFNLGIMYYEGYGVAQDYEESFKWQEQAAENGNANAQFNLGTMYYEGIGVDQDYYKAFAWSQAAARQGHMEAQNNLGSLYAEGKGTEKNETLAFIWYKQAAEQGYENAQIILADIYYRGIGINPNHQQAIHWYKKLAAAGNAHAQYNLGTIYYNGEHIEPDYKEGLKLFQQAAAQDHRQAQYQMGYIYENGIGVMQNYEQALGWYRKAVGYPGGIAAAQYKLGYMYEKGIGTHQNQYSAIYYYENAAAQGHAEAQYRLGNIYFLQAYDAIESQEENGLSEGENEEDQEYLYNQTLNWYTKAAAQGHAAAQNKIGFMYAKGLGVEQDTTVALSWFTKAGEQLIQQRDIHAESNNTDEIKIPQAANTHRQMINIHNKIDLINDKEQVMHKDRAITLEWLKRTTEKELVGTRNQIKFVDSYTAIMQQKPIELNLTEAEQLDIEQEIMENQDRIKITNTETLAKALTRAASNSEQASDHNYGEAQYETADNLELKEFEQVTDDDHISFTNSEEAPEAWHHPEYSDAEPVIDDQATDRSWKFGIKIESDTTDKTDADENNAAEIKEVQNEIKGAIAKSLQQLKAAAGSTQDESIIALTENTERLASDFQEIQADTKDASNNIDFTGSQEGGAIVAALNNKKTALEENLQQLENLKLEIHQYIKETENKIDLIKINELINAQANQQQTKDALEKNLRLLRDLRANAFFSESDIEDEIEFITKAQQHVELQQADDLTTIEYATENSGISSESEQTDDSANENSEANDEYENEQADKYTTESSGISSESEQDDDSIIENLDANDGYYNEQTDDFNDHIVTADDFNYRTDKLNNRDNYVVYNSNDLKNQSVDTDE